MYIIYALIYSILHVNFCEALFTSQIGCLLWTRLMELSESIAQDAFPTNTVIKQ